MFVLVVGAGIVVVFWVGLVVSLSAVVGKSLLGGLFQPVLVGFADGGSVSFVLVERGGCSRCPGCRCWLLFSTRTESSSALSTVGSVMASRWGHSVLTVPLRELIQAWSVAVAGCSKC